MNHKQSFTRYIVIGLLVALTTTVYSATTARSGYPDIVDTWETVIPTSEGNPRPNFDAVLTFFADGNMVEVNSGDPATTVPGRGVWIGAGNKYLLTFVIFTFDDKGKHTGKVKTNLSIKMDDSDHFKCTYTADLIDLAGKVTKKAVYGICTGTRLEVELP
jgi:hypothetical protein